MKTVIYYFTGTGNSLAAAKKIAAVLGDCELVPIASLTETKGEIIPAADRVGILCPVYDAGVPRIVAEFAERLDISRAGYTFAIVTFGGIGVSALHQLIGIFEKAYRKRLDAAFAVEMPGNFPPVGKPPAGEKRDKILIKAAVRLTEIAGMIDKCLSVQPGFSPVSSLIKCFTYPPFYKNVHDADKKFSVSEKCTGCGTCAKVCPVKNIQMENEKPVWQHRCELCCACLHFCPTEAIQLHVMRGTEGRGRYRHPGLKVEDMKTQQGEKTASAP
jgi:ferredoxin